MSEENLKKELEKEDKNRKRNIRMMIILIALFVIGIIVRWDFVSKEISEGVGRYFSPDKEQIDSTMIDSTKNTNV